MSNSDRSKGSPIGLVRWLIVAFLCVAAIVGCLVWPFSIEAQYQREADQQTKQYTAHTYAPKYNACLVMAPMNQPDCVAKAANEARQDQRSEQDLVAQKISALWAFVMGAAAVIGAVLSAVGVFLVWTTFRATKDGNEINREIGRAQVRSYLACKEARFVYSAKDRTIEVEADLVNIGQSPARMITISGLAYLAILKKIPPNKIVYPAAIESAPRSSELEAAHGNGGTTTGGPIFSLDDFSSQREGDEYEIFQKWNAITFSLKVTWVDVFKRKDSFPLYLTFDLPKNWKGKGRPAKGKMVIYSKDSSHHPTYD